MLLEGKKIYLRTLQRTDLPKIVMWKNDPEIADLVRGSAIMTNLAIENRRFDKSLEDGDMVRLTITTKNDQAIGMLALCDIDKPNKKASLGMLIGEKKYWRQGYGQDVLSTILSYLFYQAEFNRVSLEVFDYNLPAIKLYEKIGFKIEGTQRQGLFRKARFHDIYLMGILKEEFDCHELI